MDKLNIRKTIATAAMAGTLFAAGCGVSTDASQYTDAAQNTDAEKLTELTMELQNSAENFRSLHESQADRDELQDALQDVQIDVNHITELKRNSGAFDADETATIEGYTNEYRNMVRLYDVDERGAGLDIDGMYGIADEYLADIEENL